MPEILERAEAQTTEALEPDAIEGPDENNRGRDPLALAVYSATPGSTIQSNIEAITAKVEAMLADIGEWEINDDESYREAKRTRAEIRKAREAIDAERRRLKDLYEAPLREFEAQVKRATGPLTDADMRFKGRIDEYESRLTVKRRNFLRDHYEELAPDLAELVPFERFIHIRGTKGARGDCVWLRRSMNEIKARDEMEAALLKVAKEWDAIGASCTSTEERTRVQSYYAESLDAGAALTRLKADREREETIKRQREEEAAWRARQAQSAQRPQETSQKPTSSNKPTNAQEPRSVEPARNGAVSEPVCIWRITLDVFRSGTRSQMVAIGKALKELGLTGGHITKEG